MAENEKDINTAAENTANAPQATRFSLMAENIFAVDENESIAIVGMLHGTMNVGDEFFIVHPKFPAGLKSRAETLVVNGETPKSASNCRVAVKITSVTDPAAIPKFSVVCSTAPQIRTEPSKPVENPFLVGLTMEYNRFVKDSEFTYTFMAALLTSRYITPAAMEISEPNEDGKVTVKNSRISFRLLRHPNDENTFVLPVFTDAATLRLWKAGLEEKDGEKPKTLLMPFERAAEVGLKNGGIVINPFGPASVFVSNTNIENTIKVGKEALARQKQAEQDK